MTARQWTHQLWTTADIPDQSGRIAAVTGANSGVGFQVAKALAGRGATVLLACRDLDRAKDAADRIAVGMPPGAVEVVRLDLASLASVRQTCQELGKSLPRLDLLINNAGLMFTPYAKTVDGFESQLGVNHFGHFALTGLLLDKLLYTPGSRVVTVSSLGHRRGKIKFDDLMSRRSYRQNSYGPYSAYNESKLANLLFTYELARRLDAAGAPTMAVAAHPGRARHMETGDHGTQGPGQPASWSKQSMAMGALPVLRAATDPGVLGGQFYGPDGRFGLAGYPVRVPSSRRSYDIAAQRRLWHESERLTGVRYRV